MLSEFDPLCWCKIARPKRTGGAIEMPVDRDDAQIENGEREKARAASSRSEQEQYLNLFGGVHGTCTCC